MENKIQEFIQSQELFNKSDQLLLAISGGIDSVVLAHVLKKLHYDFVLVHCNFQLRGEDSLKDEKFVKHLAIDLDCEVLVKRFEIDKDKKSVQLQARNFPCQSVHKMPIIVSECLQSANQWWVRQK